MAENFLTYQEVDALARLTVSSSRVTATNMLAGDDVIYVYYDKGAAYFDGNFNHYLTIALTASDQGGAQGIFWAMTNNLNDFQGLIDASQSFLALRVVHNQSPNTIVLHLTEQDGATNYGETGGAGYAITAGTVYYIKLTRDETVGTYGTFYCYIYSNAERTTLLETLSITLHTSTKDYRYVMPMQSYDATSGTTKKITMYSENLIFGSGAATVLPTVTQSFPTSIGATTATGNGHIVSIGLSAVTEHGHCWATTINPTTADSKTTNGAGAVGAFTSAITGLTPGTRYYIRAYATNSFGTSYSAGTSVISGDSGSIMMEGNIAIVETRFHYVGADGREYYLQGTGV